MLCYMDKTFCTFYKDCDDGAGCIDALTDKVSFDAEKWARRYGLSVVPIAQYAEEPECFIKKENNNRKKGKR